MNDRRQPSDASRQIPGDLVRRGMREAVHDLPPGAEVNCAQALVLAFGEELRAAIAARQPAAKGQGT